MKARCGSYEVEPEEFGISALRSRKSPAAMRRRMQRSFAAVLDGEKSARRDVVLLNAAAALVAAGSGGSYCARSSHRGQVD